MVKPLVCLPSGLTGSVQKISQQWRIVQRAQLGAVKLRVPLDGGNVAGTRVADGFNHAVFRAMCLGHKASRKLLDALVMNAIYFIAASTRKQGSKACFRHYFKGMKVFVIGQTVTVCA